MLDHSGPNPMTGCPGKKSSATCRWRQHLKGHSHSPEPPEAGRSGKKPPLEPSERACPADTWPPGLGRRARVLQPPRLVTHRDSPGKVGQAGPVTHVLLSRLSQCGWHLQPGLFPQPLPHPRCDASLSPRRLSSTCSPCT